jgi:hypothetical protein
MNPRLIAYVAFIAAIFIVGPQVSFAAEHWAVKAPGAADKVAPTRIVTGDDPAAWPLDYSLVNVGAPCDCSRRFVEAGDWRPGMPQATPAQDWCLVKGRRMIAAACEVAK